MSLKAKILIIVGAVLLIAVLGFTLYEVHETHLQQAAIQDQLVQQKTLMDGITRSAAQWATKDDLDAMAKQYGVNISSITSDLSSLNATLTAINVSTANSQGQVASNLPSTNVIKIPGATTAAPTVSCDGKQVACPNQDPYGYQGTTQQLAVNEDFASLKVPFGTIGFSASQQAPWSLNVSPRQYNAVTVIGTDPNQRIYAYNKLSINVEGKDYDVPVTNSKIEQQYPSPTMTWWNPRIFLGFDAGVNVSNPKVMAGPSVNLQVSSYGKYKTQPDLSILQVGAAYDVQTKRPDFLLTPIQYNIGQHIPLMNNLYVGPSLGITTQGDFTLSLGLHAAL